MTSAPPNLQVAQVSYQGATSAPLKPLGGAGLYQGMTSVMPQRS